MKAQCSLQVAIGVQVVYLESSSVPPYHLSPQSTDYLREEPEYSACSLFSDPLEGGG
jgi:hypothetical protein